MSVLTGAKDRRTVRRFSRLFRLLLVVALLSPLAVLAISGTVSARPAMDMGCGVMGDMGQPCCADACAIIGSCAVLPEPPRVPARIMPAPACIPALARSSAIGRVDPPDPPPPRARND